MTDALLPALMIVALALAYGVGWEGCRLYWTRRNTEAMRKSGLITPEYMKQVRKLSRRFDRESRKRWGGKRRKQLDPPPRYDDVFYDAMEAMDND